jgi:hypothetical protein
MRLSADALVYVDPRPKEAAVAVAAPGSSVGSFTASSVDPPIILSAAGSAAAGFDALGFGASGFGSLPDSSSSSSSTARSEQQLGYQTHPLNQTAVPEPADWSRAKRLAMRRSKEITAAAAFPYTAIGKLTLLTAEGVPR